MAGENLMGCVGINVAAPAAPVILTIAGHELAAIPGGFSVVGDATFADATPHWVHLPSYFAGTTAVSNDQYQTVMALPGPRGEDLPGNYPKVRVMHADALAYLNQRGGGLRLGTEAEWEVAARGPAVNIRATMEELGLRVTPEEIGVFIEDRFQNLVFGVFGQIYNDPTDGIFRELVKRGLPFFGWRVYATPSAELTREDVWYGREGPTNVNWGPANAYGLKGMTGGVLEWVNDWYAADAYPRGGLDPKGPEEGEIRTVRGGSWFKDDPQDLRVGCRVNNHPNLRNGNLGFRVFAPQHSLPAGRQAYVE